MSRQIYLDYASATPMSQEVLEAMQPYFSDKFYNPSGLSLASGHIRQDIKAARAKIAMWLGARPSEIYFTAGATEANNLAIQGLMRRYPKAEVLISAVEHDSVLAPAGLLKHKTIPVDHEGRILLNKLSNLISDKTVLVSVMMVNNEIGTVQPIKEIAALVKNIRQERNSTANNLPIYLHIDAAQAGNLYDLHAHRLSVDLMSINAGKIYGPKQTGALFVKTGVELEPLILGGGQEGGLRSGTENVAGIIGLSKALDTAQKIHAKEYKRLSDLRRIFVAALESQIPSAAVNGSKKYQSPHLISCTFPGIDNERLMMVLDEHGIICAVGSACSASSDEPSHVLKAIGLSDEQARSTLRFSLGRHTSKDDIERAAKLVAKLTASNQVVGP